MLNFKRFHFAVQKLQAAYTVKATKISKHTFNNLFHYKAHFPFGIAFNARFNLRHRITQILFQHIIKCGTPQTNSDQQLWSNCTIIFHSCCKKKHYIVGRLFSYCHGRLNRFCVYVAQIVNKILIIGYFQLRLSHISLEPSGHCHCWSLGS